MTKAPDRGFPDRGFPDAEVAARTRRAYDVHWRATEAGIAAAHPGATCSEVARAMLAVIRELDVQASDVGRLGHGLGMQLTEWPSNASWDHTVITENMVLTLEPSLAYGEGRVMVHEEYIVVRADGTRLLTARAGRDMPII